MNNSEFNQGNSAIRTYPTQPQTTIPTEDYVSKRFEAVAPIRLDTNSDNYVEYLLGGKARKINKIGVVGEFGGRFFKKEDLVAKDNFADVGSNIYADANRATLESNERVKLELTKEYLIDPQGHTSIIVNKLIENMSKSYRLSENILTI